MELASGVFPGGRSPCIAICCVKPPAGFSDSNQQRRAPLHCAMAAPSVEDGDVFKIIKNNTVALGIYSMGAIYYKICIDSYEIYLLECFSLPLSLEVYLHL